MLPWLDSFDDANSICLSIFEDIGLGCPTLRPSDTSL